MSIHLKVCTFCSKISNHHLCSIFVSEGRFISLVPIIMIDKYCCRYWAFFTKYFILNKLCLFFTIHFLLCIPLVLPPSILPPKNVPRKVNFSSFESLQYIKRWFTNSSESFDISDVIHPANIQQSSVAPIFKGCVIHLSNNYLF